MNIRPGLLPLLALATAALAQGCQTQTVDPGAPDVGRPVAPNAPFNVGVLNMHAPDAEGWTLAQSSQDGMTFERYGATRPETYVATVSPFRVPPGAAAGTGAGTGTPAGATPAPGAPTPEAFSAFVRTMVAQGTDPTRFTKLSETLTDTNERGYPCLRWVSAARDNKPAGPTQPVLLEIRGLYCQHPRYPDTGFAITYSHRGVAPDPGLSAAAESFFQGVQVPAGRPSPPGPG